MNILASLKEFFKITSLKIIVLILLLFGLFFAPLMFDIFCMFGQQSNLPCNVTRAIFDNKFYQYLSSVFFLPISLVSRILEAIVTPSFELIVIASALTPLFIILFIFYFYFLTCLTFWLFEKIKKIIKR